MKFIMNAARAGAVTGTVLGGLTRVFGGVLLVVKNCSEIGLSSFSQAYTQVKAALN